MRLASPENDRKTVSDRKTTEFMKDLSNKRLFTLREVDRLIAERILGVRPCKEWKRVSLGSAGGPALMHKAEKQHDHECFPDIDEIPTFAGTLGGPPRYTTDIAMAWRLLDKMHERHFGVVIAHRAEDPTYEVELSPMKSADAEHGSRVAEGTAPLAICLAALRAYGIDVAVAGKV